MTDVRPTFVYDDGGRAAAGRKATRDCVSRGIACATGRDYLDVYRELNARQKAHAKACGYSRYHQSARNGVFSSVWEGWLREQGWKFTACRRVDELPREGVHLLDMPGHVACLNNWKLRDTWDCLSSRRGRRSFRLVRLDGYWTPPAAAVTYADNGEAGQLALFAA